MITIKHPDGERVFKTKPYWNNPSMRVVIAKIKKGKAPTDVEWDRMIKHTDCRPRVLIVHSKYEPSYYIVTPETYKHVCKQLVMEWHKAQWFHGAQEVAALKALKEDKCIEFWAEWGDDGISIQLEHGSTVSEDPPIYENIDELIELAEKAHEASENQYKAQRRQQIDNQIAELQEKREELN